MVARKRLRGEEYVGRKKKVHSAVKEGPPCNCKWHCFKKVGEAERMRLRGTYTACPPSLGKDFSWVAVSNV